jgi:integrase
VLKGVLLKKPRIWNPDPDKSESEEGEEEGGIVIPEDVIAAMINSSSGPFGVFIRCAALMGMRSSEITQMRKTRIDFQRNCIRLLPKDVKTGSKTGKGRLIPIHPGALKALKDQYERSGDSPYLFPNQRDDDRPMDPTGFYGQWNVLKAEVGMPAITPHDLRHSYATKIFSNPHVNPVLACKALGMTMSTAERVYIHFDETHLQAVANNFSIPEIEV